MNFNLAVILTETAASSPDKAAALYDGGQLTYGELDELSDRLAVALEAAGIEPGDPVAMQLPNIPQFLIAYFGILKAGAVAVPLNPLLKAPEMAFHLGDSGAKILITWEGVLGDAGKGAEAAGLTRIYAVGHAEDAPGAEPFERLLAVADGPRLAPRTLTDTAVIIYTSGTTGRPKGAELTHVQLYMNADIPGRLFGVQSDDIVLTVLPLFHVYGLSSVMNLCVRFGGTMSLIPRFDPAVVLAAIERDRATVFDGVPAMFIALLSYPELGNYDVSSLRIAISGGASIPGPVLDGFEKRFGVADPGGLRAHRDRVYHDLQHQRRRAPGLQRGQAHLGHPDPDLGRQGQRAAGQGPRRRGRHPRPARDEGLPEQPGGHRRRVQRRLVPHR